MGGLNEQEAHCVALQVAALARAINSKGKVFVNVIVEEFYNLDDVNKTHYYRPVLIASACGGMASWYMEFNDVLVFESFRWFANTHTFEAAQQIKDFIDTEECRALYEMELLAGGLEL